MENINKIISIDISKQASALSWLRLTDYALVILCGSWLIATLPQFFDSATYATPGVPVLFALIAFVFGYAAFVGWRHVGVIDSRVWASYSIVFPLLVFVCALVLWVSISAFASVSNAFGEDRKLETMQELSGMAVAAWVGAAAAAGWLSLVALRRMKIAGLNSTVDQLLGYLSSKAGSRAEMATHIRRINPTRGYLVGGLGVLVLLAVAFAPMPSNKILAEFWLKESNQVSLVGFFLLVRARRHFQVDADSLLEVDRRAPILFLRSFDDDEKQVYTGSDKAFLDFSLETRLSNHFSHFGPFIAIGSPKESVPQLGAARVLLSDDEWQPRVLGWMQNSQMIVMYSGKTHWVNWELRQVLNNGCAERLILMIPEIKAWRKSKREAEVNARVAQIREVFKDTPWEEELMQFDDFMGLRAMLFCPDGSMVMVKSRSRSRDAYHLAALIAHQLLLDPAVATRGATLLPATYKFRFAYGVGAALALGIAILLVGGTMVGNDYGDKLVFERGELYYQNPVTQDEAKRVGEYLKTIGYFSGNKATSAQLVHDQQHYGIRFVIDPGQKDNLLGNMSYAVIGREIARQLPGGGPLQVTLTDSRLNSLKVLPNYDKRLFGKGELHYSDEMTSEEVEGIGRFLSESGYFNDDKSVAVYIGKTGEDYDMRFVVDPSRAAEAEIKDAFSQLGQMIAAQVLGGKPVVVNLCDDSFGILSSNRVVAAMNAPVAP